MADEAGTARTRCAGRRQVRSHAADSVGAVRRATQVFDNNGSFLLAGFGFFIFFAWFMGLFWVFGDLFRSKDIGGVAKTLWTLFLIILPLLGMLIYLIARGRGMSERALAAHTEAQSRQDAYIRSVAAPNGSGASVTDEIT